MRYNNFIQKVAKRGGGGVNFIVCARSQNILATSREGKGYGGGAWLAMHGSAVPGIHYYTSGASSLGLRHGLLDLQPRGLDQQGRPRPVGKASTSWVGLNQLGRSQSAG